MDKQLSGESTGHSTTGSERRFLLSKPSFELKVTLNETVAAVEVAASPEGNRSLAEDVARVQEKVSRDALRCYSGRNVCAFLLILYSDQGWHIQELDGERGKT